MNIGRTNDLAKKSGKKKSAGNTDKREANQGEAEMQLFASIIAAAAFMAAATAAQADFASDFFEKQALHGENIHVAGADHPILDQFGILGPDRR